MQFIIANTFQESLAKLQVGEQNAAKLAAMELQINPAHPSLKMHRLEKVKDKSFWSARANDDVRLIVHRTDKSCLLCYVDHHDSAYAWAERRKLTVHPTTGAAQMVVLKETVQEIVVRKYVEETRRPAAAPSSLLPGATDAELLSYGVPTDWLEAVRQATDETVLDLVEFLPEEAREAVLNLATGSKPEAARNAIPHKPVAIPPFGVIGLVSTGALPGASLVSHAVSWFDKNRAQSETEDLSVSAFSHPDAQRRFRTVGDLEELQRALDAPWEKWTVFLHPAQRLLVKRNFNGRAKVAGSAGTGKTIVALHRAVHLADVNPSARVLLATFSEVLANALSAKLRVLIGNRPRLGEQIEVLSMEAVGKRLYVSFKAVTGARGNVVSDDVVHSCVREAFEQVPGHKFSLRFVLSEWDQVVDAWQLRSWEEYRDVSRLGRKTRLREPQREVLWSIFERALLVLREREQVTEAEMFTLLARYYKDGAAPPYDFAVVDEAQDVSIAQLRCLATMTGTLGNGLFFAGDTGQRIFQQPFSWKQQGVDVRGRCSTLKVNYRTSHQIRSCADRLLDGEVTDVDGLTEDRRGTVSVFNGPPPDVLVATSVEEEQRAVAKQLLEWTAAGLTSDEMVVFVRSRAELVRAEMAVSLAGLPFKCLDGQMESSNGVLPICTMHLAKGLEFRAVVVMASDEEILPLQARIQSATDPSELEDMYNSERQLLYVACTRARDSLLISSAGSPSEFLQDLRMS